MKRDAIILLAIILCVARFSTAEDPSMLEQALQVDSATGADGVLLLGERHVILNDDGRVLDRRREVQRILTDHGLDAYGDPIVTFNSRSQDLSVEMARTLRGDGEVVDVKDNALNVVTPKSVARAPHFADVQDMAITLLGLEIGAATDVKVEVVDRLPYREIFWGREPLWDTRDIVEKEIVLRVPSERDIVWFTQGVDLDPEVKKSAKTITYRFRIKDVKAINPNGLDEHRLPMLMWVEDVGNTILARRLLASAPLAIDADDPEGLEQADRILDQLDAETADEMWSPGQRARGIHRRIRDGLAEVVLDRTVFGPEARDPDRAFRSGYADPLERIGILHTVFARMGHDPQVIAVLHRDPGKDARLHPDNVSQLWLRVSVGGQYLYLDAAGRATSAEPRGDAIFVVNDKGAKRAKYVKPASTRSRLDLVVDLSGETPVAKGTLVLRGAFNPYASIQASDGGCPVKIVSESLGSDSDLVVSSASFVHMGIAETAIAFEATPSVEDHLLDITLPSILASDRMARWELYRPGRSLPLMVEDPVWEKVSVQVRLPEHGRVLHAPELSQPTGELGPLSVFHDVGISATQVTLVRRMTLDAGVVNQGQMDEFVDLLADALSRGHNRIIVELPSSS